MMSIYVSCIYLYIYIYIYIYIYCKVLSLLCQGEFSNSSSSCSPSVIVCYTKILGSQLLKRIYKFLRDDIITYQKLVLVEWLLRLFLTSEIVYLMSTARYIMAFKTYVCICMLYIVISILSYVCVIVFVY